MSFNYQQPDRGLSVQGERKFNATLTSATKSPHSKIGSLGGTFNQRGNRGKSVNFTYDSKGYRHGSGVSSSKWAWQYEALKLEQPKIVTFKR